ncbi:MAG: hypothetical protein M1834_003182 [Cirrosporium novae-zelandiae]|nr:MAG: hypothetical protein M1834_003182 [Cirrosporium novae-zelandiae]
MLALQQMPLHPSESTSNSAAAAHSDTTCKRPKLTLQTTSLPLLFPGTHPVSADSPTARNTLTNKLLLRAQSQPYSAGPSITPAPLPFALPRPTSSSRASNANRSQAPYTIPSPLDTHAPRSILRNSPLPSARRPATPLSSSGHRKLLFRAEKRVRYATPLEEEIKTRKYIHRDIDLYSSPPSRKTATSRLSISPPPSSKSEAAGSTSETQVPSPPSNGTAIAIHTSLTSSTAKRSLQISHPIPTDSAIENSQENTSREADIESPRTPAQGRRKRRREWVWTLGPLPEDGDMSREDKKNENETKEAIVMMNEKPSSTERIHEIL